MKQNPRVREFSLRVQIAALQDRQRGLKTRIAQELKRPAPCNIVLQELKRHRLRIKDELARHEGLLRTIGALPPQSPQSV